MKPNKFRMSQWLNTQTNEVLYGIQARVNGEWLHCHKNGTPDFYSEEKQAKQEVKRLNAEVQP